MGIATGFRGKERWGDLSDYLVHFPGGQDRSAIGALQSILEDRKLIRGPEAFGAMHWSNKLKETQRCVCLSEIPLGFQKRMVDRRGNCAVAFARRRLIEVGAAPVWYLEFGSPQRKALDEIMENARQDGIDPDDDLWKLTPFIDTSGNPPQAKYTRRFEWEREWRLRQDFAFEMADVAFIALPTREHDRARSRYQNLGYEGPFVDASWSVETLEEKLASQRIAS